MADAQKSLETPSLVLQESSTSPPESAAVPTPTTVEKDGSGHHDQGAKKDAKKKEQYVNPERVLTGGSPREKLSEEELAGRIARIREQNEKIKQRRLDVQADEDAFKKTQDAERVKRAKDNKIQEGIDRAREMNARRKMDRIQGREWDSGKKGAERAQPQEHKTADTPHAAGEHAQGFQQEPTATDGPSSLTPSRGRGGNRGRGRGGGRRGQTEASASSSKEVNEGTDASTPSAVDPPAATAI